MSVVLGVDPALARPLSASQGGRCSVAIVQDRVSAARRSTVWEAAGTIASDLANSPEVIVTARSLHPFPARMAPEIALEALATSSPTPKVVLDPMCGSGTVLAAAVQNGHRAIGVDIDPLAAMMSRMAVTPIAGTDLVASAEAALRDYDRHDAPWGDDEETERFVDYWFGARQKRELTGIMAGIRQVDDEIARLALCLAVSRIIVTKTPQASLAADTSHSRPHRVVIESEYDVIAGFKKSVSQLSKILDRRVLTGSGRVVLGDARSLDIVPSGSIDISITSPPYLNALDYLRGHRLALVWFGHRISDLRARRSASIGAERAPDKKVAENISAIVDIIENEAVDRSVLPRPMLERFAMDCSGFAGELGRAIAGGGAAVLVVGNSTLRGNYIRNDEITRSAMTQAGFLLKHSREREIPPSSRYMAIGRTGGSNAISKRMRTEVVQSYEKA